MAPQRAECNAECAACVADTVPGCARAFRCLAFTALAGLDGGAGCGAPSSVDGGYLICCRE